MAILGSPLFFASQAQAQKENLWSHPEWIRLNHYKLSLFGKYQSKIQGKFFLSPDGQKNPKAELEHFLQMLNTSSRDQIACRYPARIDFLNRHYFSTENQIPTCPARTDWIQKMGATRVSLIFASSYLGAASSTYGHTFLKFINESNQGGRELVDYAVNYSARTGETDGALYALYGLFGNFPGGYTLLPYHQLIKEYTNLEGRDIWEYDLDLSQDEVRRLIFYLLEMESAYFDYYYLDDNCSYHILWALQIARPSLSYIDIEELYVIPNETIKLIQRTPGMISKTHNRYSLRTQFEAQYAQLSTAEKKDVRQSISSFKINPNLSVSGLEATQTWASINESQDPSSWRDFSYQLSLERSKRKELTKSLTIQKENPTEIPDTGLISFGTHATSTETRTQFQFGFAYMDFLTRGSLWQELQVLNFTSEYSHHQLQVPEWNLIKLRSTDDFLSPLGKTSWGFRVGGSNLNPYAEGQWGLGFDPHLQGRLLILPTLAASANDQKIKAWYGADLLHLYEHKKYLRSQIEFSSRYSQNNHRNQISAEAAYDIFSQQEVRLKVLSLNTDDLNETQLLATWKIHFLFD